MQKIEVNAMTGLVEMIDMEPDRGFATGWGWTHWDGPDAGGKLFAVYRCQDKEDNSELRRWIEIYIEGQIAETLPHDTKLKQWVLDQGWRPVIVLEYD